jgi:hypothetical protein
VERRKSSPMSLNPCNLSAKSSAASIKIIQVPVVLREHRASPITPLCCISNKIDASQLGTGFAPFTTSSPRFRALANCTLDIDFQWDAEQAPRRYLKKKSALESQFYEFYAFLALATALRPIPLPLSFIINICLVVVSLAAFVTISFGRSC